MELNQEIKDAITTELVKRVKEKGIDLKCPICNNQNFMLVDGFSRRDLSKNYKYIQLGQQYIPSISIICDNCGYLMDFALGTLGFLKKEESKEESKNDKSKD